MPVLGCCVDFCGGLCVYLQSVQLYEFVMFSQGMMFCESYHCYLFCNNEYNAVVLLGVKDGAVE